MNVDPRGRPSAKPREREEFELDLGDEECGGEDEGSGGDSNFITLGRGRYFVRKFEVIGMRWDEYLVPGQRYDEPGRGSAWRLQVYLDNCPPITLHDDEAASVLREFGLPEGPPAR